MPAEIFFYHLQRQPLEMALPRLLEKCLERGWKSFVQVGTPERLKGLDAQLWTFRDDSFLAHGLAGQDHEDKQPILMSSHPLPAANGAQVRFFVDGALPNTDLSLLEGLERAILMFDDQDEVTKQASRSCWKELKEKDFSVSYWKQTGGGGWEKLG
ncbi:DNA polymerase III subunit chi [Cohaesibacter gelatinilyticus]|uniref:DNA polymerase III, chi subunit n=1 Tax=Cohaesibacter gelatinilyticus TaxID=372072 RepID=A0A285NK82_9HYPH|nr:DNA polymerase III subunit chi [Cohaesibacter gelatinilyticus]SNZ08051.1 DNA polymerase III, chi subunit [Cohaesibacter gelatinilyticus]